MEKTEAKRLVPREVDNQGQLTTTSDAHRYLMLSAEKLLERGKDYDRPKGERSITATVAAFNSITGKRLTPREGWLFLLLLKNVRLFTTIKHQQDTAEDLVAYAALMAEESENDASSNA